MESVKNLNYVDELDQLPKILILGKTQQGKSTLIKHLDRDNKIQIGIGNGVESCTKGLNTYKIYLRGVHKEVVLIDT